jgi:hypothetical protein
MTTQEIMALANECEEWAEAYSASQSRYSSADVDNVIAIRDELRKARAALQSAIEALQADAQRYRWLRVQTAEHPLHVCKFDPSIGRVVLFRLALDAAIDAAMALDKR